MRGLVGQRTLTDMRRRLRVPVVPSRQVVGFAVTTRLTLSPSNIFK